jgi:hypothetical protein
MARYGQENHDTGYRREQAKSNREDRRMGTPLGQFTDGEGLFRSVDNSAGTSATTIADAATVDGDIGAGIFGTIGGGMLFGVSRDGSGSNFAGIESDQGFESGAVNSRA